MIVASVAGWLFERVTGTPWTTTVQASRDGVRLTGAVYRDELSCYTDAELIRYGDEIVARARAAKRAAGLAVVAGR